LYHGEIINRIAVKIEAINKEHGKGPRQLEEIPAEMDMIMHHLKNRLISFGGFANRKAKEDVDKTIQNIYEDIFKKSLAIESGYKILKGRKPGKITLSEYKDQIKQYAEYLDRWQNTIDSSEDALIIEIFAEIRRYTKIILNDWFDKTMEHGNIVNTIREMVVMHNKEIDPENKFDTAIDIFIDRLPDAELSSYIKNLKGVIESSLNNAEKFKKDNQVRAEITIVASLDENSRVVVFVEDKGKGIKAKYVDKLNKGESTRGEGTEDIEGTGSGFVGWKKIINGVGGEFKIESEYGQWTRVTIALPVLPSDELNKALEIYGLSRNINLSNAIINYHGDNNVWVKSVGKLLASEENLLYINLWYLEQLAVYHLYREGELHAVDVSNKDEVIAYMRRFFAEHVEFDRHDVKIVYHSMTGERRVLRSTDHVEEEKEYSVKVKQFFSKNPEAAKLLSVISKEQGLVDIITDDSSENSLLSKIKNAVNIHGYLGGAVFVGSMLLNKEGIIDIKHEEGLSIIQAKNEIIKKVKLSASPITTEDQKLKEKILKGAQNQGYSEGESLLLEKMFTAAEELYKNKNFRSGETYLRHVLEVAFTLIQWEASVMVVGAAILHKLDDKNLDLLEKGKLILREYLSLDQARYIAEIVRKVININSSWPYLDDYIKYIKGARTLQYYQNALIKTAGDPYVLLLLFADKLHGLPVKATRKERNARYQEIEHVYTRLASRLNAYSIFEEIRNRAFQLHNPKEYRKTSAKRKMIWGLSYGEMRQELERKLEDIMGIFEKEGLLYQLEARVKTTFSIYEKVTSERRPEYSTMEALNDIIGLRIINENTDEVINLISTWLNKNKIPYFVKPMGWSKGYEAIHIRFKIKFPQSKVDLPYEIMVMNGVNYVKYIYGISEQEYTPEPTAHWVYKANELFGGLGAKQVFESDMLRLGSDFTSNFYTLYESLKDNDYIMYMKDAWHGKEMSVVEVPAGSFPIDLANHPQINILNRQYGGFLKVDVAQYGEDPVRELSRNKIEEKNILETGMILIEDSTTVDLSVNKYREFENLTKQIRTKLRLRDLIQNNLPKWIEEGRKEVAELIGKVDRTYYPVI
ncbi:MAG TPA: HD domain-containing protein, partial [Candidatus Omnitrophica bacterium]|nr:HD domain-containing protein [Candidatus Omnitrophota bacterium]